MKPKNSLYFLRLFRTPNSEVWLIDFKGQRLGVIHLHFTKCIYGDVILWDKITDSEMNDLISYLKDWLVDTIQDRDDFIFSVYQAKEIGSYSDTVDHDDYAPTKKDLKEHGVLINKMLSKYQDARGQLNEHVVKEYFAKLGFVSIKASQQLDALKVDVIAEDDERLICCQVKSGKVDNRKMHDICKAIAGIDESNGKRKIIAIVADSFPSTVELIKDGLEAKFGLRVWSILKSQILQELPQYRKTL
ncbi:restriction endonuclease [Hymenobacter sp. 15J16-1T3B]|uniref:restriction endonuclease n=1 Tax=Hymenobacter sp. 15J16-1T3B TaxID=2886941 RepID=UPI001D0FA830|nr:restriction endonuclease [Hymenobacter sp. 15J16-1T3B]MCC3158702.1 restriction endonuclease [Hymenobacter sp. 15J16-1T3B]